MMVRLVSVQWKGRETVHGLSARALEEEQESKNLSGNANKLTAAICSIIAKGVGNMTLPSFHKIFLLMLQNSATSAEKLK